MTKKNADSSSEVEKNILNVVKNVVFGKNVKIYNFVNLYGCVVGDDTQIGAFVEVQKNSVIGNRCKISSHTFICEGVHIGNDVFIGHGVMFTNDKYPRASKNGQLLKENDWTVIETYIGNEVSIGSNATILCGIRIGCGATIGAGAVVTKNVPDNMIVVGNPAIPLSDHKLKS